jgi:phage baseplate assembly protein W
MTAVHDAIAADLATMTRVVEPPSAPYYYGTDLSCVTDLTVNFDEVDMFSVRAIAEALIRRLITPRGALIDGPNYGTDIRGMLNHGVTQQTLQSLSGAIRAECCKDDRVRDAQVAVTYTSSNSLQVSIAIVPADPTITVFRFTFAVSDNVSLTASIDQG